MKLMDQLRAAYGPNVRTDVRVWAKMSLKTLSQPKAKVASLMLLNDKPRSVQLHARRTKDSRLL